jgi:hypothetical protein
LNLWVLAIKVNLRLLICQSQLLLILDRKPTMSQTVHRPGTIRLAPSILSVDFARLGEEVRAIEAAGADLVHFDVMDNHYVPNLTIGPLVCEAIRPHVRIPIDVHLMVEPVDSLIPLFAKAGANIITFHPEASRHVDRTLSMMRELGCKAGLVLNPASSLQHLDHVMDKRSDKSRTAEPNQLQKAQHAINQPLHAHPIFD